MSWNIENESRDITLYNCIITAYRFLVIFYNNDALQTLLLLLYFILFLSFSIFVLFSLPISKNSSIKIHLLEKENYLKYCLA